MRDVVVETELIDRLPLASNCEVALTASFDQKPPEFDSTGQQLFEDARAWYGEHARRFADALQEHTPGGFVDALLGELLHRKASIFRVANPARER